MPTSAVQTASAACRIRRARCPLPWAGGQLWSSEAKRSWLSRRWLAENSCSACHTVYNISSDGYTEPACACYDTDGTCEGILFTDARVPQMSVQHCPNCSCAFSPQQKTSANYKHIAKCLADAVGKRGYEIVTKTLLRRRGAARAAVVVPTPPKPASWKPDMRSSIANMDAALTRAAFLRTTHPHTTW